jgi:hypothetical protein
MKKLDLWLKWLFQSATLTENATLLLITAVFTVAVLPITLIASLIKVFAITTFLALILASLRHSRAN